MLHKDLVPHKTKTLLCEFLNPVIANMDKPRRKFLHQTVAAILLSGCLVVKELTRWIHDDCSDLFYWLKRILNHLVSPSADLSAAVTRSGTRCRFAAGVAPQRRWTANARIFHVTLPASGSLASLKALPCFASETSTSLLSDGRQTSPFSAVESFAKATSSSFDQSICMVDCASWMCGRTVPSRTSITTGIAPASM